MHFIIVEEAGRTCVNKCKGISALLIAGSNMGCCGRVGAEVGWEGLAVVGPAAEK